MDDQRLSPSRRIYDGTMRALNGAATKMTLHVS